MATEKFITINDAWVDLAQKIIKDGKEVAGTLELNNISFTLSDIRNNVLSTRDKFSLNYYLGEMIWYGAGANDIEFISKYGKIWEKLSDDYLTNNSAYGYILKKKYPFDQIELMVDILHDDPNSRRAVININVPNQKAKTTNDEMCTIALQFVIRGGKLNATGIMRSNDLWTGTPYDIFYFTEIQKLIAGELGVMYGSYTHFVVSAHIYSNNIEDVAKSIDNYYNGNLADSMNIDGQKLLQYAPELYNILLPVPKDHIKEATLEMSKIYGIVR